MYMEWTMSLDQIRQRLSILGKMMLLHKHSGSLNDKNTQYYYIISVHNGLALNLDGDPNVDQSNKAINLWNQQNDKADYLWYLSDEGNGKVSIYNKQTNKCLDVVNGRAEDNTWIEQYTPNHTVAQLWTLEEKTKTDYPDRMQYGDHGLYINSVSPEKNNYEFTCN